MNAVSEKFNLDPKNISVMTRLTLMLIVKAIAPADFLNELSHELNMSFQSAKMLGVEIENYLKPIENDLRRDLGIDIKLIQFGKPGPQQSNFEVRTTEKPAVPTVDLQSFKIKSEQPSRPLSPLNFPSARSGQEKEREIPATPFILHQETPTVAPSITPRPQEAPTIKSSLTMKVQNFYQSSSVPERPVQKPISVKIETPVTDFNTQKTAQPIKINPVRSSSETLNSALTNLTEHSPSWQATGYSASNGVNKQDAPPTPKLELPPTPPSTNNNEARVVHYSDLRTPLNTLGLPKKEVEKENVVDLRKLNTVSGFNRQLDNQ